MAKLIDVLYRSTYRDKMENLLDQIRAAIGGRHCVGPAVDRTTADALWTMTVKPAADSYDRQILNVEIRILEESEFEYDDKLEGVNFTLTLWWHGAETVEAIQPFKDTDEMWVRTESAIAERFALIDNDTIVAHVADVIDEQMQAAHSRRQ